MTVERTGHVHRATVNLLTEAQEDFWGPRYSRVGPTFCARPPPACPARGWGQIEVANVGRETRQHLSRRRDETRHHIS